MQTTVLIQNPITQETQYGSYTPIFFEGNFRYDNYKSKVTGEEMTEAVLALNNPDFSPVQTKRTYDSMNKCHCCFAGYAHTVNLCNNSRNNK
jgi:hypothetical protein